MAAAPVCVADGFFCFLGCRSTVSTHMPHWGTLRRVPALPHRRRCCGWPPRIVSARVAEGDFKAWELDLRCLGPFHRTCAAPMASTADYAFPHRSDATVTAIYFPCNSGFSFEFWVCFLFRLQSDRVWVLGLWVFFFFLGLFGFSCGFWGVCWVVTPSG
jgi:hypothetical protein